MKKAPRNKGEERAGELSDKRSAQKVLDGEERVKPSGRKLLQFLNVSCKLV
jgi:hypothetical protein